MLTDRYRLDTMLGRGGMGEVWRAWDLRLRRPVAVKVLAGSSPVAEDAVARLRHEARTAARLSDPHAVSVYDVGTADGCCFLVMELVPGRSLAQELVEEGPLPPARVARIAAQTAAGLAAAHRRGVVHRDIKPSNLLMDEDGSVKIADFGIARGGSDETTAAATRPGTVLGTSLYLSPEAAMGWAAGSPADVYGLGCSLYELLTGSPPFTGEHPVAVLRQHVEEDPVPPRRLRPQTPPEMDAYLLGMLAKQPELRPTAQDVADWFTNGPWQEEIPAATLGLPVAAPPLRPTTARPGTGEPDPSPGAPKRTPARRKASAAGAVTAVAALAAAAFAFASPLSDDHAPHRPAQTSSSQDAGSAPPSAAASAPAAGAAAPGRPRAPGAAAHTRHTTPGTAASPQTTSPVHGHRPAPASAAPTSAPHSTAPRTTPTAGATGPTGDPTPTKPTPTSTATTPPANGDQGA